ncbi:MAG: SCO1664 family protein [Nocardioidaceae bacterium]
MSDDSETRQVLERGELSLDGRLITASNATFFGRSCLDGVEVACVYKPVRGERPLWDFPNGTLAGREVATYVVSEFAGWHLVPATLLVEGPFGSGMVQQWIDEPDDAALVDLVPAGAVPDGWLRVLDAVDSRDESVSLVHADHERLASMAVLDVVVNNADRKGGHVLVDADGAVYGCDHGVTFHVEDKLRTVLWGWAGDPLAESDLEALSRLAGRLRRPAGAAALRAHLSVREVERLTARIAWLSRARTYPLPTTGWPVIPWPAF